MERDAVIYHQGSCSFQNYLSWSTEKQNIAAGIIEILGKKRKSLLDIGAGNGILTQSLESLFEQITAVEPAETLFKELQQRCSAEKYHLIQSRFESLELKDQFEVILSSHSLKFMQNQPLQLQRINHRLEENGTFLLVDNYENSGFLQFYERFREKILGPDSPPPGKMDYHNFLRPIFTFEKKIISATLDIPSLEEAISLLDFIYDVDYNKISAEVKAQVREELSKEYGQEVISLSCQQVIYVCSKNSAQRPKKFINK